MREEFLWDILKEETTQRQQREQRMNDMTYKRKTALQKKRYRQKKIRLTLAAAAVLVLATGCVLFFTRNSWAKGFSAFAEKESTEAPETAAVKVPRLVDAQLTVSLMGDCTLGTDEAFNYDTSLNAYFATQGADYFFQNVRPILEADDLSIVNMEGTLTESTERNWEKFAFKGSPDFVNILSGSSVEASNIANNHSHDYGDQSFEDTKATLKEAGITPFGYDDTAVVTVKGVKVGLVGIYELNDHLERKQQLKDNIAQVRRDGADLIIVVFHWGNERETVPDSNQMTLGHLAVDYGADLVVGHHPHVLQGLEEYRGRYIVYSLANFCFGGNSAPTDMDTMIFQQTFTLRNGEVLCDSNTKIIPCSVSSATGYNNYQPTPSEGSEAERILQKIEDLSSQIPAAP